MFGELKSAAVFRFQWYLYLVAKVYLCSTLQFRWCLCQVAEVYFTHIVVSVMLVSGGKSPLVLMFWFQWCLCLVAEVYLYSHCGFNDACVRWQKSTCTHVVVSMMLVSAGRSLLVLTLWFQWCLCQVAEVYLYSHCSFNDACVRWQKPGSQLLSSAGNHHSIHLSSSDAHTPLITDDITIHLWVFWNINGHKNKPCDTC